MAHSPTGEDVGAETVADAARRVVDALVRAGSAVANRAGDLAGRLSALADEIEAAAPPPAQRLAEMWAPGRPRPHNMVTGSDNPLAPPLLLRGTDDGVATGSVVLGWAYQGPAGYAHGGMSALLLDHALGMTHAFAGTPAMTAHLELDFHRPVPMGEELTITARQGAVDGRKLRATGEISSAAGVHVSASGLFLAARPGATPSGDHDRSARP